MPDLEGLFCGIWLLFIGFSAASIHHLLTYTSRRAAKQACRWIHKRASSWHWAYVVFVNGCLVWFFWFIHYDYVNSLVVVNFVLLWINGVVLRGYHGRRASRILLHDFNRWSRERRLLR